MKILRSVALMALGIGRLGSDLVGQEKAEPKMLPKTPAYALEITGEEPIAAELPSQTYDLGFGCTSDGSIGVNVLLPPDKAMPRSVSTFYTISSSAKTVSFDFSKINDLALRDGQGAIAYEVGDRDVDFLFSALPVKSAADMQAEDKAPAPPPGWFLARFDRDGAYHGATELNLPRLVPQRMAAFDDGDLLIFALDEANRQPQLMRYSMIGQKVHYYFPDEEFSRQSRIAVAMGSNPDKGRMELIQLRMSMLNSQFGHFKDAIVLLQRSEGAPLFLAYPDGLVRTVKLPKVEGLESMSLIPSDDGLYVEYRKPRGDPNGSDEILILELDANTGEELRRIAPGLEVACIHQGAFRVIRHEGQHTFQFFNASVVARVMVSERVPAK